jgi:hypothetical protein
MLLSDGLSLVANLELELDLIKEFNRQPLRGIEQDSEVMRLISIEGLNPNLLLLSDRVEQLVFGCAHKGPVEHFRPILLERASHRLPGLEVVTDQG